MQDGLHQQEPEASFRGINLVCNERLKDLPNLGMHRVGLNNPIDLGTELPKHVQGLLDPGGALDKPAMLLVIHGRSGIKLKVAVVA